MSELGTVEDRYTRDWTQQLDDRKERTLDEQSLERQERNYVDPETGISEVTGTAPDPFTDPEPEEPVTP